MEVREEGRSQEITFETNCDDVVCVDAEHPLRFADEAGTGGLKPYVLVRAISRHWWCASLFYDLVACGVEEGEWFGVWSAGTFFPMKPLSEIGALT